MCKHREQVPNESFYSNWTADYGFERNTLTRGLNGNEAALPMQRFSSKVTYMKQ